VPAARAALLHAYHIGFSTTLNHLMLIAAVVAFVGSLGGYALVRQSDFVPPPGAGAGAGTGAAAGTAGTGSPPAGGGHA
jgi:hypothetical protein